MSWNRRIALYGSGLLAGLVAGLVLTLLMATGRYWLGISPPPEAVPDRIAPTLDIATFFDLFGKYGGYNGLKKFGIRTGIEVLFAVSAVVGVVYAFIVESTRSRSTGKWKLGLSRYGVVFIGVSVLVVWVAMIALLWPVLGTNYRGLPPSWARIATGLGLLVDFAAFGLVLVLTYRSITGRALATRAVSDVAKTTAEPVPAGQPLPRRAILAAGAGALVALPSYRFINRLYDRAVFGYDGTVYSGPGVQPIAPNDKFYTVTKNVVDPNVKQSRSGGSEIGGLVEHAEDYDFDDLAALPAIEQETTLMCISNAIGAGLSATPVWTGVPMR